MPETKPLIVANFEADKFSEEEIEACLSYIAELYREQSGVGLRTLGINTITQPQSEPPDLGKPMVF